MCIAGLKVHELLLARPGAAVKPVERVPSATYVMHVWAHHIISRYRAGATHVLHKFYMRHTRAFVCDRVHESCRRGMDHAPDSHMYMCAYTIHALMMIGGHIFTWPEESFITDFDCAMCFRSGP